MSPAADAPPVSKASQIPQATQTTFRSTPQADQTRPDTSQRPITLKKRAPSQNAHVIRTKGILRGNAESNAIALWQPGPDAGVRDSVDSNRYLR